MTVRLIEIVTTVSTPEQAAALADDLVERKLAACANLEPIRSIYSWKGSRCDEAEVRLTLKTTSARAAELEQRIRERHPYETPMILRVAVAGANPEYARWVREQVEEDGP